MDEFYSSKAYLKSVPDELLHYIKDKPRNAIIKSSNVVYEQNVFLIDTGSFPKSGRTTQPA